MLCCVSSLDVDVCLSFTFFSSEVELVFGHVGRLRINVGRERILKKLSDVFLIMEC